MAFWVVSLLTIILFILIIRFVMRRIFAFSPIGSEPEPVIADQQDVLNDTFERVYCVSLPYSGLDEKLTPSDDRLVVDLRKELKYDASDFDKLISEILDSGKKQLVLKRFEYLIEDEEANAKKLALIEQVISKTEMLITIVSTVDTSKLFETYKDKEDPSISARWSRILSGFKNIYWPIEKSLSLPMPNPDASEEVRQAQIMISKECGHSTYLQSLVAQLNKEVETWTSPINQDDVILHIQNLSNNYYHSIWATCSDREKLLIYDLAEDGFVNEKNAQTIDGLLSKGILIIEDSKLRLINRSFRNFVLTVIERDIALKTELESATSGSWSAFRTPLMVVIIALAAFILITQQGSFNSIVSFLASLSAALMTGFRLFESFNTIRGKK